MKYLRRIAMMERKASVERNTSETQIKVEINLDGTGQARFDIGVPFLEHMLDQVARHGLIDMHIECRGDLHIDDHHTVETSASPWVRPLPRPSGTRRVSVATATPMCPWTKPCPAWRWTSPAAPACRCTYPLPVR